MRNLSILLLSLFFSSAQALPLNDVDDGQMGTFPLQEQQQTPDMPESYGSDEALDNEDILDQEAKEERQEAMEYEIDGYTEKEGQSEINEDTSDTFSP